MSCLKVAKQRVMRHDLLASALRHIVTCASCSSSMEPPYRRMRGSWEKKGNEGMHRGDILVVLPEGRMDIVDVVVRHPACPSYAGRAARESGSAAMLAEREKRHDFDKFADGAQYGFRPFAAESYGCLGAEAIDFMRVLGDLASAGGRISKSAFMTRAYKVISVALQKGNGLMYGAALSNFARAAGRQFVPGMDAPVLEVDGE